jgi:hypothetical protein
MNYLTSVDYPFVFLHNEIVSYFKERGKLYLLIHYKFNLILDVEVTKKKENWLERVRAGCLPFLKRIII